MIQGVGIADPKAPTQIEALSTTHQENRWTSIEGAIIMTFRETNITTKMKVMEIMRANREIGAQDSKIVCLKEAR